MNLETFSNNFKCLQVKICHEDDEMKCLSSTHYDIVYPHEEPGAIKGMPVHENRSTQ